MAHLNNAVRRASDTGPQVGALLGDGAGDGRSCDGNNEVLKLVSQDLQDVQTISPRRTLHLSLGVDDDACIVLKVDEGALLSPPRLALADDNGRGHYEEKSIVRIRR